VLASSTVGSGAVVSSTPGAFVTLTAGAATNLGSVSLGPGTWFVTFRVSYSSLGSTSNGLNTWVGPNSASSTGNYFGVQNGIGSVAGGNIYAPVSCSGVVTLASTTTVYLVAQVNFTGTGASVKGYGTLEARRMR
jgi:hypothetical protein